MTELTEVHAPLIGTVARVLVAPGDRVTEGSELLVLESMKMEHGVSAVVGGLVSAVLVEIGDTVAAGQVVVTLAASEDADAVAVEADAVDLDHIRPDLAELRARQAFGLDEHRPAAVARRHELGRRTIRENLADLFDDGTFVEYGSLAVAAQRRRRSMEELIERTPADGLITGIGEVDGQRCVAIAYDYTVLAGTQGAMNHKKKDRILGLALEWQLPVVLFAEGGGGRPGDTDQLGVAGLDLPSFARFAALSGQVPVVGIVAGPCFAGNAALLGCCDLIIATPDANIGMGGPAMIEGGGLGQFAPIDVGPVADQVPNGVIDVLVDDEAAAVAAVKRYLGYFGGRSAESSCPDQRRLRHLIPEDRVRSYDVRVVIEGLVDTDSALELRPEFGVGIITTLARVGGRALGIMANNPLHLGGAIDAAAADKGARFLQLCEAHGLPVLSLCDTPGFMVGPEVERTAQVRHVSRLFVAGAKLTVPLLAVVLRKGYGLGAMAMTGGSFHAPLFNVAWPTGEFGGMGLEGAVRLGYRRELEAVDDVAEREELFQQLVARSYEHGRAINMASFLEIDQVIDPADTRHWIERALASVPPRSGPPTRAFIDTW